MGRLPVGTVTFLFTDIEGSTRLLQELGDDYRQVSDDHCRLLRDVFESSDGTVVSTEGDSFFAVFKSAPSALQAAVEAQRTLAEHPWPDEVQVKVRIGLHTGEGTFGGDNYVGLDVNRAARISNAGHGGQVLVSDTTRSLVEGHLAEGVELKDLGEHRLKDLAAPERIYQILIPGHPVEFPKLRSLNARPNNLPAQLTSFVGRENQTAEVKQLVRNTRLLTLSGPGGTGKTRLSIQAASEMLGDFSGGVFFVALAPITDPQLVPSTVAQALGLQEAGGRGAAEVLEEFLADKEIFLVLDNFEQVVAAAPYVSHLLTEAPGLKIMVSSREVLRISGEQEYPVPPLTLPDFHDLPSLDKLTQFEAVALFIQRGTAVKPGFRVTNENAPAVAEICTRLDGLPLAIELAAARLRVLTPQAILERLESRLDLLTSGGSDLPARQQTLRNAIAWSYDLLDDAERRLFRRLAVFTGGWVFEDAETVCDPDHELGVDTVDGLSSLVEKSLVRQHEDRHGDSRFLMLETIREFGLERLRGEDDEALIRRRQADALMHLAAQAAPNLLGADQNRWLNRLEDEHDNIRSALKSCVETGEATTGLEIASSVWRFWHLRGHMDEGRKWLTDLVSMPDAAARDASRAKGLNALGSIAYWQSDFDATKDYYEEALSINREVQDRPGIAETLYNLAFLAAVDRSYDESKTLYNECRELYEQLGERASAAYAEFGLGMVAWLEDDHAKAREVNNRTLEIFTSLDDRFGVANSVGVLARVELEAGDLQKAGELWTKALDAFLEMGDLSGVGGGLDDVSTLATIEGEPELAVRLGGASEAMKLKIGGRAPESLTKFVDPRPDARKTLSEAQVEAAWQAGLGMPVEDAVAETREYLKRPRRQT